MQYWKCQGCSALTCIFFSIKWGSGDKSGARRLWVTWAGRLWVLDHEVSQTYSLSAFAFCFSPAPHQPDSFFLIRTSHTSLIRNFSILRIQNTAQCCCSNDSPPYCAPNTFSACHITLPFGLCWQSVLAAVAHTRHQRGFLKGHIPQPAPPDTNSVSREGFSCFYKHDSAVYCQWRITSSGKWSFFIFEVWLWKN